MLVLDLVVVNPTKLLWKSISVATKFKLSITFKPTQADMWEEVSFMLSFHYCPGNSTIKEEVKHPLFTAGPPIRRVGVSAPSLNIRHMIDTY